MVTYAVVVGVNNADLRLKPGMTANVTFITANKADALKIPTAALRFKPKSATTDAVLKLNPGEKRLYVLKDGKPAPVAVTVGVGNDKETEITSGLAQEALVVLEAQNEPTAKATKNPLSVGGGMGPPR